jgi:hypothetical protein
MYCTRILIFICFLNFEQPPQVIAQDRLQSETVQGYELSLRNIIFDSTSGNIYGISLREYGLKKSNYAVMVNAFVQGHSTFFHIPGQLANGSSFGFRLKAGRHGGGDSLTIIRRTGTEPILISRITIVAFRAKTRSGVMRYDKAFSRFVLDKYLSGHLRKGDETECYFSTNP